MVTAQFAHQVKEPLMEEHVLSLPFHVAQENTEFHKPNAKLVLHSPKFQLMALHALDAQPVNSLTLTDTAQCAHHTMKLKIKELAYHWEKNVDQDKEELVILNAKTAQLIPDSQKMELNALILANQTISFHTEVSAHHANKDISPPIPEPAKRDQAPQLSTNHK